MRGDGESSLDTSTARRYVPKNMAPPYPEPKPVLHLGELDMGRIWPHVDRTPSRRPVISRLVKRSADILISASLLILLSPFLALIGCMIRFGSPGPAIFWQSRSGLRGKPFRIAKFRTMVEHQDSGGLSQCYEGDPRVTRIGRFLRGTRLDELPQLWNVLRGEMSLVGPRPHPVALDRHCAKLLRNYGQRFAIRPGITGLAQVRGSIGPILDYEDLSDRIRADLEYIDHWSLRLDLKILCKSVTMVLRSRNKSQ